ncbi:hypothetical protein DL769_003187 [Monosporascus sp. CRB-8-3]|nr:hypothetical protein DL769_003187 [Monosporascus sp. CRB-8-3]
MDITVQLPTDPGQRRRLQNRIAQRKFRRKREQQQSSDRARHDAYAGLSVNPPMLPTPSPTEASPASSSLASMTAPASQGHRTDNGALDDFHNAPYNPAFNLDDPNFWDLDTIEDLLAHASNPSILPPEAPFPNSTRLPDLTVSSPSAPISSSCWTGVTSSTNPLPASDGDGGGQGAAFATSRPIVRPLPPSQNPRSSGLSPPIETSPSALALRTEDGWLSTLHIAVQKGHEHLVRLLMQYNVDCNETDSDGRTPLIHAVVQGHEGVTMILLAHGARLGDTDQKRRSALHYAVLHRRENMLSILLRHYTDQTRHLNIDAQDESGWSPLHMAVDKGFEPGVRMLLQAGANLNARARKCPYFFALGTPFIRTKKHSAPRRGGKVLSDTVV